MMLWWTQVKAMNHQDSHNYTLVWGKQSPHTDTGFCNDLSESLCVVFVSCLQLIAWKFYLCRNVWSPFTTAVLPPATLLTADLTCLSASKFTKKFTDSGDSKRASCMVMQTNKPPVPCCVVSYWFGSLYDVATSPHMVFEHLYSHSHTLSHLLDCQAHSYPLYICVWLC